jgi:hypothetical protein
MRGGPNVLPFPVVVVTVMPTASAGWAGAMTVIWSSLNIARDVPGVSPNRTPVAPENPDPVMVTGVPPAIGPPKGEIPVIWGTVVADAGTARMKRMKMIRIHAPVQNGTGLCVEHGIPSFLMAGDRDNTPLSIVHCHILTNIIMSN